jgi:glycosyltransferase involved in cell wall biosynthesis
VKVRVVVPAVPKSEAPNSGGDRYDVGLCEGLCALGHDARVCGEPERGAIHLFDGLGAATWAPRLSSIDGLKVALLHLPASALDPRPSVHAAEAALLAGCDAVHFVSPKAEADTRSKHPSLPPTWVALPGIDHFRPVPRARERRLVAVGHVLPAKGVLEALELVAQLDGPWHFDWLGALDVDAPFARKALAYRDALGLNDRVSFLGRVAHSRVADTLARASAFVATSRYESWGLALGESLRAGVPLVGATSAGLVEFLEARGARTRDALAWLTHLLDDDAQGQQLRAEAEHAGTLLPTWASCAQTTAQHLEAICAR